MRARTAFCLAAAGACFAFQGCSKTTNNSPAPEMKDEKVQVNTTADPGAQMMTEVAQGALKKKSYTEAVATIVDMGKNPNMTPQQVMTYRNLRQQLQAELADAASKGDPKAQEAIQMLRMATSGMVR